MRIKTRKRLILAAVFFAGAIIMLLAPFVGMERMSPRDLLGTDDTSMAKEIFWRIRVPRVIAGFLAGAALALGGLTFQALFRNPLATPFTLGVSSGAAFGAALHVRAGLALGLAALPGRSFSAFAWALLSIGLVYGLTRLRRGFTTATMLIAGVAVNFFFSSLILFMQYLSDFTQSFRMVRWLMGGLESAGAGDVSVMVWFVLAGSLIVFMHRAELDLLSLGDDVAAGRGVAVVRTRRVLFFSVSLMVGGIVAVCGPIAFVGMMVPHICRLVVGETHRALLPATFVFGGSFLVACDAFARTVIAPAEIPVGVITSMLGGPFFIWLLIAGASERSLLGRGDLV